MISVLAIEDEESIRRLFAASFENSDYHLLEAESAAEGVEMAVKRRPDLILLDMSLPDQDGISVINKIRGWSKVPIIIISGLGSEELKVRALEAGADDYITKPFGVPELLARMRVALRHSATQASGCEILIFQQGDLKIDFEAHEVLMRGVRIELTPIEFKLLCALAKHAGKIVTNRQLLVEVWGNEYSDESQYLRVYVGTLRKKFDDSNFIQNEPRIGYRLLV